MSLPKPEEKRRFVEDMFDQIAPRYDLVNRVMTMGIDRRWRRRAVAELQVGPGNFVVDLGCGTGDLIQEVSRTGASVAGVDISADMMKFGLQRMPGRSFVRADAQCLPFPNASCDGVISGFALRNFTDVTPAMREAARVLKPGGRLAILEVNVPDSTLKRALFEFHFRRIVPLIGRALSTGYAYQYLAASTDYLPAFPEFTAILETAGFENPRQDILLAGAAQIVTAQRTHRATAPLDNELADVS